MDWNNLLNQRRLGRDEPYDTRGRTSFQRDHDRVVFCSAFRRMQDKTQVFPLAHVDYVRTRLTHSLEVSCVGRSLGLAVAEELISKYKLKHFSEADFGTIVATACLAHDIGNPPFGHSGEESIQAWFLESETGQEVLRSLTREQKQDFLKYEGNAQGLRILTRLQHPNNSGGLQLTCATLAAMNKYPRPSILPEEMSSYDGISIKKHGYFQSERDSFEFICQNAGLLQRAPGVYARHPLAFLVEAADDICYHFIDFGDGFRLGHITYEQARDLLLNILDDQRHSVSRRIETFHEDKERVEYLVGRAISELISQVSRRFVELESEILSGEFDQELISLVKCAPYLKKIKELSVVKVYGAREVIEVEAAGFEVLGGLLDLLVKAVEDVHKNAKSASRKSKKLLQLIPNQFLTPGGSPSEDPYERLIKIADFVTGMTDSYAISYYRKLKGISMTGGNHFKL